MKKIILGGARLKDSASGAVAEQGGRCRKRRQHSSCQTACKGLGCVRGPEKKRVRQRRKLGSGEPLLKAI